MNINKAELIGAILGVILLACVLFRGESNIKANEEEIEKEIEDKLK